MYSGSLSVIPSCSPATRWRISASSRLLNKMTLTPSPLRAFALSAPRTITDIELFGTLSDSKSVESTDPPLANGSAWRYLNHECKRQIQLYGRS